ncbi:MAG: type IV secretory system conjugative DNA transfer family protein [Actinomycetales bacterium]
MTATSPARHPGPDLGTHAIRVGVLGLCAVLAGIWGAYRIAAVATGDLPVQAANPVVLALGVVTGDVGWGRAQWIAVAVELAVGLLLAWFVLALVRRCRPAHAIDRAAPHLARGRELATFAEPGARAIGQRLGAATDQPGLPIGRSVVGDRALFSSWEDVTVDIWGPRTGKTTTRAIPAVLAAPGALVVTSNKRDIVDETRQHRAARGEVWVFDPQQVIGEPPAWWWNPLDYVTDEVKARVLADLFAAGSRGEQARTDAFFDTAGRDLLAGLLLAAAGAHRPLTQVYEWLCEPGNDEPVDLLTDLGHPLTAASVAAAVTAPDKQRAGVYATAQQAVGFLTNVEAAQWFTAGAGSPRRQLNVRDLVRSGQTLYAISREGRGTLGPLVAALTVAVTEAAEKQAANDPGGRLRVPMVAVLDEAANVCRWPDLPDLYSHYGSRGIVIMTLLQSWSQGESVWGREGMRKLWSAANIRVYGGGVAEAEFLGELAQLTGEYHRDERSRTRARGGDSRTHAIRVEKVLDVADLAAMPRGRALVIPSGSRPFLVRTRPWTSDPAYAQPAAAVGRQPVGRGRAPGSDPARRVAPRSGHSAPSGAADDATAGPW